MEPNILLIVVDALRADHTSVHGYGRETTPCLEKLASDGVYIDNAFSAAPWTAPSHASMFSGVYPTKHGFLTSNMPFEPPHPPLAEFFRTKGYSTFGAVRNGHIDSQQAVSRGFQEFGDIYRLPRVPESLTELKTEYLDLWRGYANVAVRSVGAERRPSEYVTCEYVDSHIANKGSPFFGFVNINSTHTPYAPPEPFGSQFDSSAPSEVDMNMVRSLSNVTENGGNRYIGGEIEPTLDVWNAVQDRYDGEIRFADSLVRRLVQRLHKENIYDETMIIVTADHGEHFGEYGLAGHQFSLSDELLHVPLVIKPAKSQRLINPPEGLVSLIDLYPTVLDGVDEDLPATAQGESLFGPITKDAVFAEYGEPSSQVNNVESSLRGSLDPEIKQRIDTPLQCVRTEELKYIKTICGRDRAVNVSKAESMTIDISSPRCVRLQETLESTLDDDLRTDHRRVIDETRRENLRELGYI